MLLLDTNGVPQKGRIIPQSHLTFCDLEVKIQGQSEFEALYLVKEPTWAIGYY